MSATGFKITRGKGFHVTFENGWTVSVQWGGGNYSGQYRSEVYTVTPDDWTDGAWASDTAEIAAWDADGKWFEFPEGDTVAGYKTPAEVLAFMQKIARKKAAAAVLRETEQEEA